MKNLILLLFLTYIGFEVFDSGDEKEFEKTITCEFYDYKEMECINILK